MPVFALSFQPSMRARICWGRGLCLANLHSKLLFVPQLDMEARGWKALRELRGLQPRTNPETSSTSENAMMFQVIASTTMTKLFFSTGT